MRNDMLFIGDKLMDLDDDTKVTLNFKSNIFTDLSKIISNNSILSNFRILYVISVQSCMLIYLHATSFILELN